MSALATPVEGPRVRLAASEMEQHRERLYRAAYAITTATIYDADAGDGHYVWCVGNLNRLPR